MSKKTGTAKGYRVDVIPVKKGGEIGAPETLDISYAPNMKAVKADCKARAELYGLSSILVIEESAIRTARKWRVDFEDIMNCPSFEWIGKSVEVPDIPDEIAPEIEAESDPETDAE